MIKLVGKVCLKYSLYREFFGEKLIDCSRDSEIPDNTVLKLTKIGKGRDFDSLLLLVQKYENGEFVPVECKETFHKQLILKEEATGSKIGNRVLGLVYYTRNSFMNLYIDMQTNVICTETSNGEWMKLARIIKAGETIDPCKLTDKKCLEEAV